ncbi:MAG TPA: ferritin, partial [Verrucomicrobiae bacterium]|nr:ferritin [Verrucomicrobiae bacterium]
ESADLKGLLLEGLTALRSVTGMKGALQAMETNEKLTNRKYTEAAGLPLPEEILKIVRTNLTHEQRHLGYIQEILTTPRREL